MARDRALGVTDGRGMGCSRSMVNVSRPFVCGSMTSHGPTVGAPAGSPRRLAAEQIAHIAVDGG